MNQSAQAGRRGGEDAEALVIRFSFDGDTAVFTARGSGSDWNGWLRPIVDRETVAAVVLRMNQLDDDRRVELHWADNGVAIVREVDQADGTELGRFELPPESQGHYLLDLGLSIAAVEDRFDILPS